MKIKKAIATLKKFKDGRLIEKPCNVGDKVQATVIRQYNGHEKRIYGEVTDIEMVVRVKYDGCRFMDFLASDFGKTVIIMPDATLKAGEAK